MFHIGNWRGRNLPSIPLAFRIVQTLHSLRGLDAMKNEEKRTEFVNTRVTPTEKHLLKIQAEAEGMSVGDFVRMQLNRPRVRKTKVERQKVIHLARIGNNLNQIARWANTYKKNAEAAQVMLVLLEIREEFKCL
ncbi:plasmid mobilization relaxosome protein MobC [Desulfovibrio sp. JC022]|nr:plasmid mobilization relaxosome protein MobC [Desulfovibrio sp. JC022]